MRAMKRYRQILLITLSLLLALSGCKKQPQSETLEPAIVQISLPKVTPRSGGSLTVDEIPVRTVRILIFNKPGGALDRQKLFTAPTDDVSDWLRLEAHEGAKSLYVIANESDAMTASLDKLLFERDLLSLALPDKGSLRHTEHPLLMTGHSEVTLTKEQVTRAEIPLTRAMAKITLDLKQATADGDKVVIKNVSISRLPEHSQLFTPSTFTLGDSWTYTKSEEKTLTNHATEPVPYIPDRTLYAYESLGSVADSTGRAPILVVQALYNNIPTTYTAYINDNTTSTTHHYALHRNHHYQLTGTITKIGASSGLELTTNVLPWDVEEIEKTLTPPRLVSITPQPEEINYVKWPHGITFKVRIYSDDHTIWRATLSNALDFDIDKRDWSTPKLVREGIADGVTEYTVSVSPSKDAGDRTRSTQLIFTTDLVEVQGAGVTEGIRIVQLPARF